MTTPIDSKQTEPIPQVPGYPIVGNVFDIDPDIPISSLQHLALKYGEIYSFHVFGKKTIVIASQRLMAEACDEKRFHKTVEGALKELRNGIHDGLFTAYSSEENWHIAHRVLVPALGPLSVTHMFDQMKDIASQLVLKLARYGGDYVMPVTDDFTRLTLDTLALCAMDYRFNSFYKDEMHPFINAMVGFLKIGGSRQRRPAYLAPFNRAEDKEFFDDIDYMRKLSQSIIDTRLEHPKDEKDLLNTMLQGKDPKTGKKLEHSNIIDQMITFLIAGHETTSGLLSFLFYYLLKTPEAYRKAQAEVDKVLGTESIQVQHLSKLPYITACIRETLRLQPTAPGFTVTPMSEHGEILGGQYHVQSGERIFALLHAVHRDPAVYGADAEEWKPERMLDENFNKLPPGSWKPFGNGARGCIGRPFAIQEATMVTAMLMQYFQFRLEDPQYDLEIKSTLTIKPKDFFMRASLREGWTATKLEQSLAGFAKGAGTKNIAAAPAAQPKANAQPMTILYGSNSGTCEAFAQTIAADAVAHGFKASKVDTLDSAIHSLPSNEPVVIVTASYEGQPTDNAAHFYDWIMNLKDDEKLDCNYVVFGCGHSDWKQTFHRIPLTTDQTLAEHGGKRICDIGLANAAEGDMLSVFQTWEDEVLWPALQSKYKTGDSDADGALLSSNLTISVTNKRASQLRADVSDGKVTATKVLTKPGEREKRHTEIQLPTDMTYSAGDYLAVLPLNPEDTVRRAMQRFQLSWDALLNISCSSSTKLPTDHPISAHDLFSAYVELGQPATKRGVSMLLEAAADEATKKSLQAILQEDFQAEITNKRVTLLELLERYPKINLPLNAFVSALITMRVRQYSISSSPLAYPRSVSLTYDVLNAESLSGTGRYEGVASTYLSKLSAGDIVHVAVKPSHKAFHLPADPENTPIVMFCAGTGLAPFHGFIQERAAMIGAGRKLAPAHLYYGCRHPDRDSLYADELGNWQDMGAVVIHRAYSQAPELSHGCKHIDELIRRDAELLAKLWEDGARAYVCGSRGLGESVKSACVDVAKDEAKKACGDKADEKAEQWFQSIRNVRYSVDVFD
ncbi:cytochrome P450 [Piedraia hortae CBS 480.64]|uniref:Bifunctional cytochrome P450/NADPH--P450 reductase n=1 Tax=Piedraia hortae CBS 480.64 TaxID=1314780 RepID=A0A6A7C5F4_9PEZI|nr:cytochrome P450 [Piedraia hortae CBS 480.64]